MAVLNGFKRAKKELTPTFFEKKYSKELAAAGPDQKAEIYQRILDEYERQKNHKPSASSLW